MANELATAYIQLLPSFRGLKQEISRGLQEAIPAAKDAGAKAGESFTKEFQGKASAGDTAGAFAREGERAGSAFAKAAKKGIDKEGDLLSAASLYGNRDDFERAGKELGSSVKDGVRTAADGGKFLTADTLYSSRPAFQRAGEQLGDATSSGFGDAAESGFDGLPTSFGDALTGLPTIAATVGAAAGAVVVKAFGDALARGRLESSFKAALGVGNDVAGELGQRAGDLYANNYGDSLDQVGDAVTLVQRRFGKELTGDELEDITSKALTLANTFDEDLNSIVRASGKLLSTGLADNAQEAFDIITVGLQASANEGQDLLDTVNEYSTQFRKLGLDGADALNLIQQGLAAGARDSDVLADAIGEFTKRAVDGSAATQQAFGALGIEDGANRVAQGGAVARQALDETLKALQAVEDPALQAQISFQLFGTQSEDLGAALLALDLDTVAEGLDRLPGAADRANAAFDDLSSSFEVLKRRFEASGSDVANDLLAGFAAPLRKDATFADIGLAAAQSFWAAFTTFTPIGKVAEAVGGVFRGALDFVGLDNLFGGGDEKAAGALDKSGEAAKGAEKELNEYEKTAKKVGVRAQIAADGANAISAALDRNRISADLAAVNLRAAASAADAYLESVENATNADDLLAAGLSSGNALRGLLEGAGVAQSESDRRGAAREAAAEADRLATEQLKTTTSTEGLTEAVRRLDPALSDLVISQNAAAKAAAAFKDSLERSTGYDNIIGSALSLGDAFDEFRRSARRLPPELDIVGVSLGSLTSRQGRAVRALLQLGSASRDYLATLLEQPNGQARTRQEAARLRDEYSAQFRQLGLTEAQAATYLETLGLTPEQIETAIKVSGLEENRSKLEAYLSLLQGKIPGTLAASVIASIDAGDVAGAAAQLARFAKTNPIDVPLTVSANRESITSAQDALEEIERRTLALPQSFDPVTAALGGYTEAQTRGLQAILEFGDEAQGVIAGLIKDDDVAGAEDAANRLRDAFRNQVLPALGVTDEKAKDVYTSLIGLDGETVTTSINVAGAEEALQKLGLYSEILQKLGTFTLAEQFQVADLIDKGDIEGARRLIDAEVEQGRQVVLKMAVDPTAAAAGVNDFRTGTENSPPVNQPLGINNEPAESSLKIWRDRIGLPESAATLLVLADINPVSLALDLLELSLKTREFLISFSLDVAGFVGDVADAFGVGVDIAKGVLNKLFGLNLATGGYVSGPGTSTSDSIPAMLSNGEYVINASAVRGLGVDFFDKLNKGYVPGFAMGGMVGDVPTPIITPNGGPTINYSVVEAKSRPTPEDLIRVTSSARYLGRV